MGASFSPGGDDDLAPVNGINVTPFVDIVLVLLVIFMLTAPMMMKDGLLVQLPKSAQSDGKSNTPLAISISSQGEIFLFGKSVSLEDLKLNAEKMIRVNPETQALLSADQKAFHGRVVEVMDALKSGGITQFAFEIEKK